MRAAQKTTATSQSNTQRRRTSTQKKLQDAYKKFVRSQEIQIDFVRSASLDEFEQQLMKLEINGDISLQCNDVPDNDEIPAEDLQEMDAKMSFDDEDELTDDYAEETVEPEIELTPDGTCPQNDDSPFREEHVLTIQVSRKAACHFLGPGFSAIPKTPLGESVLQAWNQRLETLEKLAAWLQENRQEFLKSGDIWDLGCNALQEAENGLRPYERKCLANELGINKDTFNKYLRGGLTLAWPDGQCDLAKVFFGREAKWAWVVSAFLQYCREYDVNPLEPSQNAPNWLSERFKMKYADIQEQIRDRLTSEAEN